MALMVNPENGGSNSGQGDRKVRPGRKVLMPVGIDYQESRAGNQMAIVRFICLKDLQDDSNEDCGAYAWDTFVLTERMRRFVRILRDVPYHVVATALSQVSEDDGGVRHIVPQFQGRAIGNEIAGYFSLVGYVHKREVETQEGGKEILRRTMLEGPSRVLCKPCGSLGGIVESNVTDWIRTLSGDEDE